MTEVRRQSEREREIDSVRREGKRQRGREIKWENKSLVKREVMGMSLYSLYNSCCLMMLQNYTYISIIQPPRLRSFTAYIHHPQGYTEIIHICTERGWLAHGSSYQRPAISQQNRNKITVNFRDKCIH